jgi:galactofuranose transport system permease protein
MERKFMTINDPLKRRLFFVLFGLLAILLLNLVISPEFFELTRQADGKFRGNLVNILNNGARVCILAIGMTIVYATGGIDLSVGSVMAASGALAALMIRPGYLQGQPVLDPQLPLAAIILASLAIAMALGAVNGILVAIVRVQPIIATLIMMYSARGLAVLMVQGQTPTYHEVPFTRIALGFFLGIPLPVWIALVIFLATLLATKCSALGLFIEATGENRVAGRYVGIRTRLITIGAFVFCSLCAGVAGLIHVAGESSTSPYNTGNMIELDAIAAVIIGGTMWGGRFTLTGSIIGALIIQSLTTTVYFQRWPFEYSLVFKAIVLVIVALIQSDRLRELLAKAVGTVRYGRHP